MCDFCVGFADYVIISMIFLAFWVWNECVHSPFGCGLCDVYVVLSVGMCVFCGSFWFLNL